MSLGGKMPQESLDNYVAKILSKYQYPDRAKRDVNNAIRQYTNLRPKLDTYVFNDGARQELACLDGTVPVMYKGTYYHIPVCVWLLDSHPYHSPMCYVKPTADMQIKASRHVDTNGRVYLPYLHNWNPDSSDLLGVIQVMIIVFGEQPPVYAKPKMQNSSGYNATPYPAEPSSFMPMPNVGGAYPPVSGSGGQPYPPYNTPYPPVTSGFPPYSGNPFPPAPTSGFGYQGVPAATSNAYPPAYPPAAVTSATQQQSGAGSTGNTGTITQEHIHASLYSAVEDKVKKHLREVLAQSQAEMEVLKKTEEDLNKGKSKLEDIIARLQREQTHLEKSVHVLRSKETEMDELLARLDKSDEVDIDDAVQAGAPLYKQILSSFAEENATEDAVYHLGEALRRGVLSLDLYLKHVRSLSWKQFMLKALMKKCREKANLPLH